MSVVAVSQVRVVQGKEPNHFMAMFGGKLIIYSGGKAGWGQAQDEGPGDTYLLHVRGVSQYNTKAEQVGTSALFVPMFLSGLRNVIKIYKMFNICF